MQRKDLGIKEVFDYGEYKVKTFGGDVTLLKLNTLDGDKDLIIGMGGQIINSYNKNR